MFYGILLLYRGCWDWSGSDPGGGPEFDTHNGWQLQTVLNMVNHMDEIVDGLTATPP